MTTAAIQTQEIMERASRLERRLLEYASGRVIAKYLSILIAQRERMDAVQRRISKEIHNSQIIRPNRHSLSGKKIYSLMYFVLDTLKHYDSIFCNITGNWVAD